MAPVQKFERRNWRVILEFYETWRTLRPGETIRQHGLRGPVIASPAAATGSVAVIGGVPEGPVSTLLKQWRACLLAPDGLDAKNNDMLVMPDWLQHTLEPLLLMGLMEARQGDLPRARQWLLAPQKIRVEQSGFTDYDPEEIAWLSLIAALLGDTDLLNLTRRESAAMRHLGSRRMQWLGDILAGRADPRTPPAAVQTAQPGDHLSTHWTGQIDIADWLRLIGFILTANGQGATLQTR